MSESYGRAKQLLDQLVYSSTTSHAPGEAGHRDIIPLEQRALFERLQSFTPLTWFGKPPALSSVACAAKGWRNTGPDLLTCDSCGAKIWCKLPADLLSDPAVGICRSFEQQLTDAHDSACVQRSTVSSSSSSSSSRVTQLQSVPQVKFPILPSSRLINSYHSRVQGLQRLEYTPALAAAVVPKLVTAAQQLHVSLSRALAALLQLPTETLEQQASEVVGSAAPLHLSKQQIIAVLALCGWQVQPLLPPHLAKKAATRPSSAFAVSHLVPRNSGASSSAAAAAAATAGDPPNNNSSSITAEHAVLHCELCGCKAGLWRLSQSGPYYMSQLASKAMSMLAAAEVAYQSIQHAAGDIAAGDDQEAQNPASPTPAADLQYISSSSTIAGGALHVPAAREHQQQQQQQQQQDRVTLPDAVVSSLYHTIAGGALLGAPPAAAAGGGSSGFTASPGFKSSSPAAAGFIRTSPGFTSQGAFGALTSPSRPGPFGAPAAPAFGSAGGTSGGLFGLHSAATANVFGDNNVSAAASTSPAPAPVFGLGALREEEQRTKRRRSSSDAAAGFAAARTASLGRSMSASPGFKSPPGLAAAPGSAGHPPPAKQPKTDQAAAGGSAAAAAASAGGNAGPRSFMKQPRLLAAAAEEAAGAAAAATATFDPLGQHRSWCPWVNGVGGPSAATAQAIIAAAVGDADNIAAALAVGWSSTLLALQEQLEEQQLLAGVEQQQREDEMVGLLGSVPKPGQFESTAAVLAKARKMLDALEG